MKITFVTLCDDNRRAVSDATIPTLKNFCQNHNFRCVRFTSLIDPSLPAVWNKYPAVKTELGNNDWTVWMDADIAVVNPTFDFESLIGNYPDKDFLVSIDYNGICSGFMAFRNCVWSYKLIETMLYLQNVNLEKAIEFGMGIPRYPSDQNCLKVLINNFPSIDNRVGKIPEDIIVNDAVKEFFPNAFAMHYWIANNNSQRIINCISKLKTDGWSKDCM